MAIGVGRPDSVMSNVVMRNPTDLSIQQLNGAVLKDANVDIRLLNAGRDSPEPQFQGLSDPEVEIEPKRLQPLDEVSNR